MPSENSLLVSLGELKKIETDRLDREEEEQRQLETQRAQARKDEQRAAQENEERRQREQQEQQRREQQRRERTEREERLRLAEAERRARVEAELTLERHRLALELGNRAPRPARTPWLLLAAATLVMGSALLYLGGAVREVAARNRVLLTRLDGLTEQSTATERRAQHRIASLNREVDRLTRQIRTATAVTPTRVTHPGQPRPPRPRPPDRGKVVVGVECRDSNDPICGLTGKGSRR